MDPPRWSAAAIAAARATPVDKRSGEEAWARLLDGLDEAIRTTVARGEEDALLKFARRARKDARSLAGLVQEAIGCKDEVDMMPRIAVRIRDLLDNLERVEALLRRVRA